MQAAYYDPELHFTVRQTLAAVKKSLLEQKTISRHAPVGLYQLVETNNPTMFSLENMFRNG